MVQDNIQSKGPPPERNETMTVSKKITDWCDATIRCMVIVGYIVKTAAQQPAQQQNDHASCSSYIMLTSRDHTTPWSPPDQCAAFFQRSRPHRCTTTKTSNNLLTCFIYMRNTWFGFIIKITKHHMVQPGWLSTDNDHPI